jgi:hypothetical protein
MVERADDSPAAPGEPIEAASPARRSNPFQKAVSPLLKQLRDEIRRLRAEHQQLRESCDLRPGIEALQAGQAEVQRQLQSDPWRGG